MSKEIRQVCLEGNDGAGKTTHIERLTKDLEKIGLTVSVMASPGRGTLTGQLLRSNIRTIDPDKANRLFSFDILRSQRQIPENTDIVLWDRHLPSVTVSNNGASLESLNEMIPGIRSPDQNIFLDIKPDISWEREQKSSEHPLDKTWLQDKHQRYQQLLTDNPDTFTVIDAAQPVDTVYEKLWDKIRSELKPIIKRKTHELIMDAPEVIKFSIDNPVEVKPNVFLPMFVNFREVCSSNLELRNIIVNQLLEIVKSGNFDHIVGLESGGTTYASIIAHELDLPVSQRRKKPKNSDNPDSIFTSLPKEGSKIAIIDDVGATGQIGRRTVKSLIERNSAPELITIFNYSPDEQMTERIGAPATSLTNFEGIRQIVKERQTLNPQKLEKLTTLVDAYRTTDYQ